MKNGNKIPTPVIASAAKQSSITGISSGLLRHFIPRNDDIKTGPEIRDRKDMKIAFLRNRKKDYDYAFQNKCLPNCFGAVFCFSSAKKHNYENIISTACRAEALAKAETDY